MERVIRESGRKPADSVRAAQRKVRGDFAVSIDNSPMMVAQRKRLDRLFGRAIQRVEDEEPLQAKFEAASSVQFKAGAAKSNDTGLPDNLKSGIESLSGISMDNVRVHYNSSQPAQLNAHAYAQGSDIHLAPGQEQHLPHEAWHVVQQAQGRVRPTMQMKSDVSVNDDKSLEYEADVMGERAIRVQPLWQRARSDDASPESKNETKQTGLSVSPIQRMTNITLETQDISQPIINQNPYTYRVGKRTHAQLDWSDPRKGTAPEDPVNDPVHKLNAQYGGRSFVRGHLLNARLGGLGIWENMFPITEQANGNHASGVEAFAKEYLLAAKRLDNGKFFPSHTVRYNVEAVADAPNNFLQNPNGRFICTLALRTSSNEQVDGYPDRSEVVISKVNRLDRANEDALDNMNWGYNQTLGGSNRKGLAATGYERKKGFFYEGRIDDSNVDSLFNTHTYINSKLPLPNRHLRNVEITANSAMQRIKELLETLTGDDRQEFVHEVEDQIGDLALEVDQE